VSLCPSRGDLGLNFGTLAHFSLHCWVCRPQLPIRPLVNLGSTMHLLASACGRRPSWARFKPTFEKLSPKYARPKWILWTPEAH
jgi:hypothetical protein